MDTLDNTAHVAATSPYSWPYDGDLTAAATAVVVVTPRSPVADGARAAAVAARVVEVASAVHAAGGVVVTVTTTPPRGHRGDHVPHTLPGAELNLTAAGIDAFYGSALDAELRSRGIRRLLLVGYGMETCVHSTMRTANDQGYECLLVTDAVLSYDEALEAASISSIEMSGGIFGAVGTADAVVAAFTTRSSS